METDDISDLKTATFDEIHIAGALAFGRDWIKTNRLLVAGAYEAGMNPTTANNKRVLSALAYVLCRERRTREAQQDEK